MPDAQKMFERITLPRDAGLPVSLCDVSKTYRTGFGLPVHALNLVSLRVPSGQALAITGPSGSGKSTLLHLVGAMDTPDEGSITVGELELARLQERERAAFRSQIGFVFQRFHLLPALTALDNVAAPLLPLKVGFDKQQRARELLAAVGLSGRERDLPSHLSGGEQQRVAIARALVNSPGMLFADEPTGDLDSRTGAKVMGALLELRSKRGLTLLIATHDAGLASRCDRVIELLDGQIVSDSEG
jgi:putative ABC transport system ATP-binding protein